MSEDLFVGLISGTSVDGIDAALVSFSGSHPALLHHYLHPYPVAMRAALQSLFLPGENEVDRLGEMDVAVGALFADAALALLKQAGVKAERVRAIGSHGQTLRHRPTLAHPFTLQIGNPYVIAERCGIDVVADFRRRDMAAGGQGAPLAPAFHRAFMASSTETRVLLNLGGIANITLLPKDARAPVAFDTGPASGLLDAWIQLHRNEPFDRDGAWAASAQPNADLLARLLDEPYFLQPPPKSTGKELFHLGWARHKADLSSYDPAIVQATFLELTAVSVANAIASEGGCDRVLVCGGGAHNGVLLTRLQALCGVPVESTQAIGIDPDWVEAMAFAWLARCHVRGEKLDLAPFTGAKRPVLLGCHVPGSARNTLS
ncbi:MAG TPA: anhydro-N-acetylmuramic acid kinase [Dongiaceae bacterium]|nr:anhydro-N-acetylmuramic acid kinase [Dongiaceae bacterium]